jgi:hypothetical protein
VAKERKDAEKRNWIMGSRATDNFADVTRLLSGDRKRERQRFEAAFIT